MAPAARRFNNESVAGLNRNLRCARQFLDRAINPFDGIAADLSRFAAG